MAAVARFLADTSALARLQEPAVSARLGPLIEAGLVATCAVVELELAWSTRSLAELDELRTDREAGYEWLATEDVDWRRALDVQRELWARGQLRSVPIPDLLVSAVAERHRVRVLHYDADYDRIAAITGQAAEWIAPAGSIP